MISFFASMWIVVICDCVWSAASCSPHLGYQEGRTIWWQSDLEDAAESHAGCATKDMTIKSGEGGASDLRGCQLFSASGNRRETAGSGGSVVPPDCYLRLTGEGTKLIRGERKNQRVIPMKP